MNFEYKHTAIKFNSNQYVADVRRAIEAGLMVAARRFLLAAARSDLRVFTGFTRGAFRNLEDEVGQIGAVGQNSHRIRIGRKGSRDNTVGERSAGRNYYYYPPGGVRVLRTPEAGRAFSTSGKQNIFSIARGRTNFYFRFKVDIEYFTKSEWGKKVWVDAIAAFEEYASNHIELPDWSEYIEGL